MGRSGPVYAKAAPSLVRGPLWVAGTTRQDAAKGANNRAQSGDHSGAEYVIELLTLKAGPLASWSMEPSASAEPAVVG